MGPKSQPSDLSQRKIVLFDVVCSEFVVAQKVIKRDIGQRGVPHPKGRSAGQLSVGPTDLANVNQIETFQSKTSPSAQPLFF